MSSFDLKKDISVGWITLEITTSVPSVVWSDRLGHLGVNPHLAMETHKWGVIGKITS